MNGTVNRIDTFWPRELPPIEITHPESNQAANNQSTADIPKHRVCFRGGRCSGDTTEAKDFLFVLNADLGEEKANDPQDDRNDSGRGRFVHRLV
jgi:hypothetical protein